MNRVQAGDVLVADMTDPDWEPVMKRAAAIVTNRGGRTCHAAIIARELGIPAVVGCGDATRQLTDGADITVSCAEGDEGRVYAGRLDFDEQHIELEKLPDLPLKVMMNVGNPDRAFDFAGIPNNGVGLARLEFIVNRMIGVHPKALLDFDQLRADLRRKSPPRLPATPIPVEFFVAKLSEGIASIAAAFAPKPVILRLSDFKSNEYANLLGGRSTSPRKKTRCSASAAHPATSPRVSGPASSWNAGRCAGARGHGPDQRRGHGAVRAHRRRSARRRQVTAENGLKRGEHGLRLIMMCELPTNALLADRVPRVLRRHVDRIERHDPADPGPGPGFGPDCRDRSTNATRRCVRC